MFRKNPRAKWHDYSDGIYFVTVCTHKMLHYFGEISDGEMLLSEIGETLCRAIEEVGLHYRNVSVDSYIVMPNHFHAIIIVDNPNIAPSEANPTNIGCLRAPYHPDEDDDFQKRNHFRALLSQAIGGLKSFVTRQANNLEIKFRWQVKFYDRIIRNQREFDQCVAYIENNVEEWALKHSQRT